MPAVMLESTESATAFERDAPIRGRQFTFHRKLSSKKQWHLWERQLWKLTRVDPPERQLWATVLSLALADILTGREKLARKALTWLVVVPPDDPDDGPAYNQPGAFEWICNELDLCPTMIRRDIQREVQDGLTRAKLAA